jgi:hypothetical protein
VQEEKEMLSIRKVDVIDGATLLLDVIIWKRASGLLKVCSRDNKQGI